MKRLDLMMQRSREVASGLALLVLLVLAAPVLADEPTDQWELVDEYWYSLRMGELASGWSHRTLHFDGTHYRTHTETRMSVSRLGEAGEITTTSTFIETEAGAPVKMASRQVMSQQPVYNEWRFEDGRVVHTARQGQRETTRELDGPEGKWLTPHAAHQFIVQRQAAGAKEITYRIIDAETGLKPITVRSRRVGEGLFKVEDGGEGREVPVVIWKSTTDLIPLESTDHVTHDGELVYQETPTGMGAMTLRLVSREQALAKADVPGEVAGDGLGILPQTFITPDGTIDKVMQSRTATFKLRVKSGEMPRLPSTGGQRVELAEDGKSATIIVNIDDNQAATDDEVNNAEYLRASAMIDSDDALIGSLARRALREAELTPEDDAKERAEAMRAFVHRFITNPNLDVPFASASETARTRSGDCTEYGVLLAAMLRSQRIPARVATGLVYADQFAGSADIFGWHMWTQALIDGKWIDFDATLPVRHHAGHIATSTSSLDSSGVASDMASLIMLLGNLEIEVVDVGYETSRDEVTE